MQNSTLRLCSVHVCGDGEINKVSALLNSIDVRMQLTRFKSVFFFNGKREFVCRVCIVSECAYQNE